MPRRLRIAVSVFFALVAVVFAVLWVRSYWRLYMLQVGTTSVTPIDGYLRVNEIFNLSVAQLQNEPIETHVLRGVGRIQSAEHGLFVPMGFGKSIPIGLCIVATAALAALPWMPWSNRFSLRTMLIATTLIAVVLGLSVYFAR